MDCLSQHPSEGSSEACGALQEMEPTQPPGGSTPSSSLGLPRSWELNLNMTSSIPACVACLVASGVWKAPELSPETELAGGVNFPRRFTSAQDIFYVVLE